MNFFSIKEFFYKLNTIGFILLLLPLVVFILLYFRTVGSELIVTDPQQNKALLAVLVGIFVLALTIVHWLWRIRMRKMRLMLELANKMDGYFWLVLIRNAAYAGCSLLMASGFFLTANILFTGFFVLIMLVALGQWPRPSSFCKLLDLRGSERDMVMNDRDLPGKFPKKNPPTRK